MKPYITHNKQWLTLFVLLSGFVGLTESFKFLKPALKLTAVPIGSDYIFNCSTDGNKVTSLLKKFSGSWVSLPNENVRTRVLKKGDIFTIRNIGLTDAGLYKCRAKDGNGQTIEWFGQILAPRISSFLSISPRDQKIAVGESINFTCVSSAYPTWYKVVGKSDIPVTSVKTLTINEPTRKEAILMIKHGNISDSGNYTCASRTKFDTIALYVLPYIFKFLAPKPKNRFFPIPINSKLTMNCTNTDPSATTNIYHKQSVMWQKLSKEEFRRKGDIFTVEIAMKHAGHFKCVANNSEGTQIEWPDSVGQYVIPLYLKPPKVTVSPNHEIVLTAGQSFDFTCTSKVITNPKWYKIGPNNKNQMVPSEKTVIKIFGNTKHSVLRIVKARKSDSGRYKCVVMFGASEIQDTTSLKVYDIEKPKIISRSNPIVAKLNTKVSMECMAEGHPRPIVHWFNNGKEITFPGCLVAVDFPNCVGTKYSLTSLSLTSTKVKSKLSIRKFYETDVVLYTCRAANIHGRTSAVVTVTPDIFRFLRAKPKSTFPAIKVVDFNDNFTMDCTTSDPYAITTLYFKSGPVWKQIPKSGKSHIYTISKFSIRNLGSYRCVAYNSSGYKIEWPSSSGLYVIPNINKSPEVSITPPFLKGSLAVGDSKNITCKSASNTLLKWYKEGDNSQLNPVQGSKIVEISSSRKNHLILMIKNAKVSDTGVYKCEMTYRSKQRSKYIMISINDNTPPKVIRHSGETFPIIIKTGVKLECEVEGYPKVSIEWYKDRQKLQVPGCWPARNLYTCDSSKYRLRFFSLTSSRVRSILKIKRFTKNADRGLYSCKASNVNGVAKADMNVGN